jgi:antitoxin CcdA
MRCNVNKRATNLTVDPELLDEARRLGINLSATLEASLREAVRARKVEQWRDVNRAAIQSSNEWVERYGLPLAQYRQF